MVFNCSYKSGVFGKEGQNAHNKIYNLLLSADLIFVLSSRISESHKELKKIDFHKQAVCCSNVPRLPLQMAGSRLGWTDSVAFRKSLLSALHHLQHLPGAACCSWPHSAVSFYISQASTSFPVWTDWVTLGS